MTNQIFTFSNSCCLKRTLSQSIQLQSMISNLPEINPLDLLYNPHNPIDRGDLATLLGVSLNTIYSWQEKRRNPSKSVRILAAMILNQWRSQKAA